MSDLLKCKYNDVVRHNEALHLKIEEQQADILDLANALENATADLDSAAQWFPKLDRYKELAEKYLANQ